MTAIRTQTERKRHYRSIRYAEELGYRARMTMVRGPIRPAPGVFATTVSAQGNKHLSSGQNQAIFTSDRMPLGECRLKELKGRSLLDFAAKVALG